MKFRPKPIIRFYIRWVVLAILVGTIGMCIIPFKLSYEENGCMKYFYHLFFASMPCIWIYILHKELWEKIFATIYISPAEITWMCPFRKTKHVAATECYIGVELENSHNKLDYPYIYFSLKPYPREYEHKIDKIPCSNEFVKYRYAPEIAEYILKTLPKEQTKRLDYFHYMYTRDNKK